MISATEAYALTRDTSWQRAARARRFRRPVCSRFERVYLYTEEEIQRLLTAAKNLSSAGRFRPWTYHCLVGLLAVSGLRISEAIKLERQDVH
jgi:integrase